MWCCAVHPILLLPLAHPACSLRVASSAAESQEIARLKKIIAQLKAGGTPLPDSDIDGGAIGAGGSMADSRADDGGDGGADPSGDGAGATGTADYDFDYSLPPDSPATGGAGTGDGSGAGAASA